MSVETEGHVHSSSLGSFFFILLTSYLSFTSFVDRSTAFLHNEEKRTAFGKEGMRSIARLVGAELENECAGKKSKTNKQARQQTS